MQADVETVHGLMETEFYELETFYDRASFMQKAYTYQLLFNLERPNTYKEDKTPWQLAKEKKPDLDKRLLMTTAVDLDELLNNYTSFLAQGGNNLLTDPSNASNSPIPFNVKSGSIWSKLRQYLAIRRILPPVPITLAF